MKHHYEVAWLFTLVVAVVFGTLPAIKTMAKKMMSYIPTFGWAWALTDTIFMERDWAKDQKILEDGIKVLASYSYPIWLLAFPEGTRKTTEKFRQGQDFATRKRGLLTYKHHLVPRTKGFSHIMRSVDINKFKCIYDATFAVNEVQGAKPNVASLINANSVLVDIFIRRIPVSQVPQDPELSSKFLLDLFKEKDLLLESYFQSGCKSFTSHIPKESNDDKVEDFEPTYLRPRIQPLINTVILNILIAIPIMYKLLTVLTSGSIFQLFSVTLVVFAVHLSLKKILRYF